MKVLYTFVGVQQSGLTEELCSVGVCVCARVCWQPVVDDGFGNTLVMTSSRLHAPRIEMRGSVRARVFLSNDIAFGSWFIRGLSL